MPLNAAGPRAGFQTGAAELNLALGVSFMSDTNTSIRERIAALEKQRVGMSHGSFDYPRITAEIHALAAQLQPEPATEPSLKTHVISVVVGVLIAVIGALILFYIFKIK